jgi:hypothetical protein
MRYLTLAVGLILTLAHASGFAEPSEILVNQSAESESLPGSVIPENGMIQAIFSSYDKEDQAMFRKMLRECMVDKRLPLGAFFHAKALPKISNEDTVYFVRPAAEPFCLGFYGAHIFQFWLVTQNNKVLYSGGADSVTMYKTSHNGMYDIEVEYGGGWGTSQTKMEFDGHEYKPVVCKETSLDMKGREVTKQVKCS